MKVYILFLKTRHVTNYEFMGVFNSIELINKQINLYLKKYPRFLNGASWDIQETKLNEFY